MKIYQIYFSPTGGTKKVAEILCRAWGISAEPIDLMKHVGPLFFSEEDLCVIAVPSYGGRAPEAALRGLRMMRGNGIPTVLVSVFGNRASDDTLLELRDETRACGFCCIAAIEAVAQHSLLPRFGAGRPDEEDVRELCGFAKTILEEWEKGKTSEPLHMPGSRPYRAYAGVPLKPGPNRRCEECGLCARECPVQAIPLEEPKKLDKRKCISCMHCASICPQQGRGISRLMLWAAERKMAETCSGRKSNVLYL